MEISDPRQSLPANFEISLSTQPFRYSKLGDAHIRLIHLNPGLKNDGLSIQIHENVSLENAPVYEALSYAWGESRKTGSISCGSESIAVTQNLATALAQVRNSNKIRTLWIDQICINQDNVDESNKQVALMGRIYSKAENVVVWLGEGDLDDGMAFDFAPRLLSYLPPLSAGHGVARQGLVARHALPFILSRGWIALSRIFSRPYFRRSWIIQEVALARRAAVHCGPYVIDWDVLATASNYQMAQAPNAENAHDAHDAVAAITELKRHDHGQGNDLVDALFMSYYFNCTDPRDKVFAMLGLAQTPGLKPDYKLSVGDVYLRTTQFLVLAHGNLDILCCVSHPKIIATLPSWVPDWQAQVAVKRKLGRSRAKEPDKPRHQVSYSENNRTLTVDGWCVDTVATVADVFAGNESMFGWNKFVEKSSHSGTRSHTEIYCQTLLAGEGLPGTPFDEISAYEAWKNLGNRSLKNGSYEPLTDLSDENEKGVEFSFAMTEACAGRRLFTTTRDSLGLGPSEAWVGDAICFLGDTPTPFALRPRESYFELVGECYVGDLVEQGHPLPQLTRTEDKRDFTIR